MSAYQEYLQAKISNQPDSDAKLKRYHLAYENYLQFLRSSSRKPVAAGHAETDSGTPPPPAQVPPEALQTPLSTPGTVPASDSSADLNALPRVDPTGEAGSVATHPVQDEPPATVAPPLPTPVEPVPPTSPGGPADESSARPPAFDPVAPREPIPPTTSAEPFFESTEVTEDNFLDFDSDRLPAPIPEVSSDAPDLMNPQ